MPDDFQSKDKIKAKQARERDARLAEALRQNLRRRKVQAKERVAEEDPPEDPKD